MVLYILHRLFEKVRSININRREQFLSSIGQNPTSINSNGEKRTTRPKQYYISFLIFEVILIVLIQIYFKGLTIECYCTF